MAKQQEPKKTYWTKVAEVRTKDKGGAYLKVLKELKEGSYTIRDPRESLEQAVKNGRMTEERANELLANIPSWLVKEIVVPPTE